MTQARSIRIDPFAVTALLVVLAAAYTYYNSFVNQNFAVFTDETQIEEAIGTEFPLFVDYL
jgi:hypothetical protein